MYYNQSHCADPTAGAVMKDVAPKKKHTRKLNKDKLKAAYRDSCDLMTVLSGIREVISLEHQSLPAGTYLDMKKAIMESHNNIAKLNAVLWRLTH